tara:strand:+ start:6314 stop:7270 length:957 start_codon:yes stop_codon:yes gene_type:complete
MKVLTRSEFDQKGSSQKTLQTICLGCPFQKQNASLEDSIEDFCSANRLGPIEKNGGEVYAVKKDDTDTEYYTAIDKRICNMMRNEDWVESHNIQSNDNEKKQLLDIAREEVNIRCDFIVYLGACPEIKQEKCEDEKRRKTKLKISELASTMKSIDSGINKPFHIYAINNSGCIKPYDFINYLRIECESLEVESNWNMEHINSSSINEMDEEEACGASFNAAIKSSGSHYFCFFISGDVVPKNYLHDIDREINDNMERILVLTPEENKKSGLFIQRICEKQMSQSPEPGGFLEKLRKEAESQKCQSLIKSLSSIVKNMP